MLICANSALRVLPSSLCINPFCFSNGGFLSFPIILRDLCNPLKHWKKLNKSLEHNLSQLLYWQNFQLQINLWFTFSLVSVECVYILIVGYQSIELHKILKSFYSVMSVKVRYLKEHKNMHMNIPSMFPWLECIRLSAQIMSWLGICKHSIELSVHL